MHGRTVCALSGCSSTSGKGRGMRVGQGIIKGKMEIQFAIIAVERIADIGVTKTEERGYRRKANSGFHGKIVSDRVN